MMLPGVAGTGATGATGAAGVGTAPIMFPELRVFQTLRSLKSVNVVVKMIPGDTRGR